MFLFYLTKPLVYYALFRAADVRWARAAIPPHSRAVGATLLRLLAGIAFGLPLGFFLADRVSVQVGFAIFMGMRLAIWSLFAQALFGDQPLARRALFVAAGLTVNVVFDLLLHFGLLVPLSKKRFC